MHSYLEACITVYHGNGFLIEWMHQHELTLKTKDYILYWQNVFNVRLHLDTLPTASNVVFF